MINILLFFILCLLNSSTSHGDDGIRITMKEEYSQLKRHLELFNKSPVKSIHTKFGYIVDCIDIDKQPAFDHPLLKNHKLQRKPSIQKLFGKSKVNISRIKSIFGLVKDRCPEGTIPIRRTTKDDLILAKSFINSHILAEGMNQTHVAQVTLQTAPGTSFHGVSGIHNIYNPKVEKDQSSASFMWVRNGPIDDTNLIGVGWHVAPHLYNDDKSHLYAVWTADTFRRTGCFNLNCRGFVQTDKEIFLGIEFANTSVYGGGMSEFPFSISQDPKTKNWWLNVGNKNLGYFPASLFSDMKSAVEVGWGGRTSTTSGSPSPPMGSGHFPDNSFVHACYFRDIAFQDEFQRNLAPKNDMTQTFTDKVNCYGVEYYGNVGDVGYSLQFGGPGGNCVG